MVSIYLNIFVLLLALKILGYQNTSFFKNTTITSIVGGNHRYGKH